jgi:hypothetical protein
LKKGHWLVFTAFHEEIRLLGKGSRHELGEGNRLLGLLKGF